MKRILSLVLAMMLALGMLSFAVAESEVPTVDPTLPENWEPFAERVTITVPVYDRSKEGYPAVDDPVDSVPVRRQVEYRSEVRGHPPQ